MHHFSSALNLVKLGQAWPVPRFKAIKLNFTFRSHTQATNLWTQSKPEGLEVQSLCSLHPKLFRIMLCHVIQMQVWPTRLPLHSTGSSPGSKGYFHNFYLLFSSMSTFFSTASGEFHWWNYPTVSTALQPRGRGSVAILPESRAVFITHVPRALTLSSRSTACGRLHVTS